MHQRQQGGGRGRGSKTRFSGDVTLHLPKVHNSEQYIGILLTTLILFILCSSYSAFAAVILTLNNISGAFWTKLKS